MNKALYTTLSYVLIVLLGGVFAFMKAGSVASLAMSSSSSLLLLLSCYLMYKEQRGGVALSLTVMSFLALFFLFRYVKTGNFMPSGMMLFVSISHAVATAFAAFSKEEQKPVTKSDS